MRRFVAMVTPLLALGLLAGCPKKWQGGECQTSENCAEQAGYGKVCVQGRCEECGGDSDCKAGFVCRGLKCVPRPECESPADCREGRTCQGGACVVIPGACAPDLPCPAGSDCVAGRCAARAVAPPPPDLCADLGSVYFDFDRADLRAEARATLDNAARCVADGRVPAVTIEGNCDERGTSEYNMHLGQRRAESVKKYLVGLGVSGQAARTVSNGEERPVCTEHTEPCWQKNRRADIKR